MWSALSRVGGIFCFRCASFPQEILGKSEARVAIQGGMCVGALAE